MNKFLLVILALALLAVVATSFRHHGNHGRHHPRHHNRSNSTHNRSNSSHHGRPHPRPHHGRRHHNKTNNTNSTRPQRLEKVNICYNDKHCVSFGKSLQAAFNSTRFNRTRRFNNARFNKTRRFNSTRFNKTNSTRPQRLEAVKICYNDKHCVSVGKSLQAFFNKTKIANAFRKIANATRSRFNRTRRFNSTRVNKTNSTRPQRLQIKLCVGPLCIKKLQGFLPKNFFASLKNKTTNAIKSVSEKVKNIVKPNKLEGAKTDLLKKVVGKVTGKVCVGKVCVEKSLQGAKTDLLKKVVGKITGKVCAGKVCVEKSLQGAKTDALKKLADKITGQVCVGKVCVKKD